MNDLGQERSQGHWREDASESLVRAKKAWCLKAVILGALIAVLAPFLIPSVGRVAAGLRYPYQMDSEEGFVLWQAWQIRHGENIFRPLDRPPYVAATYGPLYPLICAATLWSDEVSFFGGRLIAALSLLAICVFMAMIIWGETRQVLATLLGPLLFLNSYDVFQWLPFYRVDFPALALGFAGLWLVAHRRARSPLRIRLACACFVAMAFTRQVELAPFLAAAVYLLMHDRPAAWRVVRNVLISGIIVALVLAGLTGGQYLVHNVYYNLNPISAWQLKTVLGGHFWLFHRFMVVALLVSLVWFVLERLGAGGQADAASPDRGSRDGVEAPEGAADNDTTARSGHGDRSDQWGHLDLFAVYALIASVGLLGVGKIGAATNYLIEPHAAWSLFLALVLGKTTRPAAHAGRRLGRRPVFFPVAIVLLLHSIEFACSSTIAHVADMAIARGERGGMVGRLIQIPSVRRYLAARPRVLSARGNVNPTTVDVINGQRIVEMLRESPGPVLSEHPIFAMLAGKQVYIQPFIMSQLAREGKWDQRPVVEALSRGEFRLIVATEDILNAGFLFHYTKQMADAIKASYVQREVLTGTRLEPSAFTYYVFEPKQARPARP